MLKRQRKHNYSYASYWEKYIIPYISKNDKVLEVGAGRGYITKLLKEKYQIDTTAVDVKKTFLIAPGVDIVVYDGIKLPFRDNTFEVSILQAVLHHSKNPKTLLLETKRVTQGNILIFEDIYDNAWEKYTTFLADSIANLLNGPLENTIFHPRNNKTFDEWTRIFSRLGFKVKHSEQWYADIAKFIPFRWHFAFFTLKK